MDNRGAPPRSPNANSLQKEAVAYTIYLSAPRLHQGHLSAAAQRQEVSGRGLSLVFLFDAPSDLDRRGTFIMVCTFQIRFSILAICPFLLLYELGTEPTRSL